MERLKKKKPDMDDDSDQNLYQDTATINTVARR
jgi:hypothetical protein